jgi:hypothetical protein
MDYSYDQYEQQHLDCSLSPQQAASMYSAYGMPPYAYGQEPYEHHPGAYVQGGVGFGDAYLDGEADYEEDLYYQYGPSPDFPLVAAAGECLMSNACGPRQGVRTNTPTFFSNNPRDVMFNFQQQARESMQILLLAIPAQGTSQLAQFCCKKLCGFLH